MNGINVFCYNGIVDPKLRKLLFKTLVFAISISFGWWILKSGYLHLLVERIMPFRFVSEIAAGILYTFFATSPISVAILVVLAQTNNPILTALLAGIGTAIGDLLIVKFMRNEISADLDLIAQELHLKRINRISIFLKALHLDFLVPVIGAVIVASPLPDELGLLMLGASKLSYQELAVLSYVLNTAGILLIVAPVNLLS